MLVQNISLQSITIYPIKSSSGIQLSNSWVEECGLSFDRRFVVALPDGQFITARTEPRLCLIQANLTATGLNITAPDMPILSIEYSKLSSTYQDVTVWDNVISSQQATDQYNQWFSRYLEKPCQLLFFGEKSERFVKNKNSQVGFADAYPLLLISQQSLNHLNSRLDDKNQVTMTQFRPNIVVDGCDEFAEDSWSHIRVGEVEFEVTRPCSRCVFTTINPVTAEMHSQEEPLNTLKAFRQVEDGDVMFGQNLVPLNQGQIKNGDKVEVIERKSPPVFITKQSTKPSTNDKTSTPTMSGSPTKKPTLNFSSWNKEVVGNNKKTILEQGEDAGLILPYSCRGGMCGRCKIKLDSGDVEQLSTDGLSPTDQEQGYVLACSAVPKSNVVLSKPERPKR
jgi:uncharacterized protein YcbX/ferredoxin